MSSGRCGDRQLAARQRTLCEADGDQRRSDNQEAGIRQLGPGDHSPVLSLSGVLRLMTRQLRSFFVCSILPSIAFNEQFLCEAKPYFLHSLALRSDGIITE